MTIRTPQRASMAIADGKARFYEMGVVHSEVRIAVGKCSPIRHSNLAIRHSGGSSFGLRLVRHPLGQGLKARKTIAQGKLAPASAALGEPS